MQFIVESGIPWAWTGGSQIKNMARDEILAVDKELNYQKSWSGYKWNLFNGAEQYTEAEIGYFTSRIPIMDKSGKKEEFSVYLVDSEDFPCATKVGLPGSNCVGGNAVAWIGEQ